MVNCLIHDVCVCVRVPAHTSESDELEEDDDESLELSDAMPVDS